MICRIFVKTRLILILSFDIFYSNAARKGLPHKKSIVSETDACKMKSFMQLGGCAYFTNRNLYDFFVQIFLFVNAFMYRAGD